MAIKCQYGSATDVGKRRTNNEDYHLANAGKGLFVVADGMGGHSSGEIASRLAAGTLARHFNRKRLGTLISGIHRANQTLEAEQAARPDKKDMGTTLTALHITDKGQAHIGHVGDSRIYRLRNGQLSQLTEDHNLKTELVKMGILTEAEAEKRGLGHVLTQAIGGGAIDPQDIKEQTEHNDVYLLCTDGLNTHVGNAEIANILERVAKGKAPPQTAAEELIVKANRNGGTDNITTLVVHVLHRKT